PQTRKGFHETPSRHTCREYCNCGRSAGGSLRTSCNTGQDSMVEANDSWGKAQSAQETSFLTVTLHSFIPSEPTCGGAPCNCTSEAVFTGALTVTVSAETT